MNTTMFVLNTRAGPLGKGLFSSKRTAIDQSCEETDTEASIEAQICNVPEVFSSILSKVQSLVDDMAIVLIRYPQLYATIYCVLCIYLYFKYVRHMGFLGGALAGYLMVIVDGLLTKMLQVLFEGASHRICKRAAELLKKGRTEEARRMFLKVLPEETVDALFAMYGEHFCGAMRNGNMAQQIMGALYTVEFPSDDDDSEVVPFVVGTTVEAQSGVEQLLAAAATKLLFGKVPFYRLVVDHDKLQKGLGAMITGTVGSLEMVLNLLLKAFGKRPVTLLRAHEKVVNDWENSVRLFVDSVRTGAVQATSAQAQMEYDRYRDQGLAMEVQYKDQKAKMVIKRGMDALISVSCLFAVRSNCTARMEPLVVCLTGGAGVGKTTLARMIAATLAKHICSPEEISSVGGDLTRLSFQKGTSEYWEGYCGQPITVMDDWLQGIPQPGVDNEVVNLIRAANQWPYPLNMASLELKGKVNFTSRALLITTNTKNSFYISKVVSCPAAVSRRLDLTYDVRVKEEYRKDGKLDVEKLSAMIPRSIACYDKVWEFVPHNMETGQSGVESISISELVQRMRGSYDMRVRAEDATRNMVNGFADLPLYADAQIGLGTVAKVAACTLCTVGGVQAARAVAHVTGKARKVIDLGASTVRHMQSIVQKRSVRAATIIGAGFLCAQTIKFLVSGISAITSAIAAGFKGVLKTMGLWKGKPRVVCEAGALGPEALAFQRNIVPIHSTRRDSTQSYRCGYGVMLDARHILIPYHFVREMRTGQSRFEALFSIDGRVDLASATSVLEAPQQTAGIRDMAILKFQKIVRGYRDIRAHFRSRGDVQTPEPGIMLGSVEALPTGIGGALCSREYANMNIGRVALLMHSARTHKGDCGALIVAQNPACARKIRGIHVAGDGTGYFCPVYAEDMPKDGEPVEAELYENFEVVAEVPSLYNNGKTGIVPTIYSGCVVKPTGAPAFLRPAVNGSGVRVDPMVAVVESSCVDFGSITLPKFMPLCVDAVVGEIFGDIGLADMGPLSYEEAVAGIPGDPFLKGLARGKSMGYPLARKYANKRPAFGAEGEYVFDTVAAREVREEYDALVHAYEKGEQGAVFRDCLKDEVLKFEKLRDVKTRLISASPVQFTILVKRLYGRFAAEFMRSRLKHGGLIGVNVYSPEWGIVRHELAKMNEDGMAAAGDYKAFDKSQHPEVMSAILSGIAKRLPHYEEYRRLFEGIERDTCNALHLGGDSYRSWMIYRVVGTLPSGHPLTSILNSIYNMVVFRMAWVAKHGMKSVLDFRKGVRLYVYGDDNVFAPADGVKDFDLRYMSDFCRTIGMVYTSEDKTSELYSLKPVGSCGFLKRGFSLDLDGYTYAPLEWASIWDMLNWRKKKTTDDEHLAEVAVTIVRELSAYDYGRFADGIELLRSLLKWRGVQDPTGGMAAEHAYDIARSWYRGYCPVWSIEE